MNETHTLQEIRSQLMAAVESNLTLTPKQRARRFVPLAGAAVLAVAVAVTIGPSIVAPGHSAKAYGVRQAPDGWVYVSWEKDFDDAGALEAELRSYGIDIRVSTVPGSPSTVGRAYGADLPDQGEAPGFRWIKDPKAEGADFAIDPEVFTRPIDLTVAVRAAHGTSYVIAEEAFEPGEPLAGLQCAIGEPMTADALQPYAERADITFTWDVVRVIDRDRSGGTLESDHEASPDGGLVLAAFATDSEHVRVTVLAAGERNLDDNEPRLSDAPCTESDAARWR